MDVPQNQRTAGNIPEYGVAELSGAVRQTLEGAFGRVRVRGEITEAKPYPSGHVYFALKEGAAKLKAILWKSAVARVGLKPENGVEVVATGRLTSNPDRSEYQLIVDRLEYAGIGALLARVEQTRLRLTAEGLFAADRKRALPKLPALIGVVTSPAGAVIRDIMTTIARRFPRDILVWPVRVQGAGAAEQIAGAIAGFDALRPGHPLRPDIVIVARGGGSLEDLMAFNEEIVVRAAAACRIPLISAVGHETDTTLIDFAADSRAPTPTAAAELAVPSRLEKVSELAQQAARLTAGLIALTRARKMRLIAAERLLPDGPVLLGSARQRFDDRAERLDRALPGLLAIRRAQLDRAERHLPDVAGLLALRRQSLAERARRLGLALPGLLRARAAELSRTRLSTAPLAAILRERRIALSGLSARLDGVSYQRVLDRGFALVTDPAGHPVDTIAKIRPGAVLSLRLRDGEVPITGTSRRTQGVLPL